jgi:hypothetical protein
VDEAMTFSWTWRPGGRIISIDLSSLMVRREVLDDIGCWDEVRVAADTELRSRIEARYGQDSVAVLTPNAPLAFSLHREDSLTRHGPTHLRTIAYGLRREYREAAAWWRAGTPPDRLRLPAPGEPRAFPAPVRMRDPRGEIVCDVLFIADFVEAEQAGGGLLDQVRAAVDGGGQVAVFQWRRYELDPEQPLVGELRRLAARADVTIAVAGDRVAARRLVILDPGPLACAVDRPPEVRFEELLVLVDDPLARTVDKAAVQRTFRSVFGVEAEWLERPEPAWPFGMVTLRASASL